MGDHGMSKNRFERLRELAGKLWNLGEEDPNGEYDYDSRDMWRWSRCPIDQLPAVPQNTDYA